MILFLKIAFMFALGSMIGWVIELFYRRFFDPANPERKWLNPGFFTGPYLPLYGFVLIMLYGLTRLERYMPFDSVWGKRIALYLFMSVCITLLELITGLIFIVKLKIVLWDYTMFKWNFKGIIAPIYSFFWVLLSMFYYFCVDPFVIKVMHGFIESLGFTFIQGLFYGIFFADLVVSINDMVNIAEFARKHNIVVIVDELKSQLRGFRERNKEKAWFFVPMSLSDTMHNTLEHYREYREKRKLIKEKQQELVHEEQEK